MFCVYMIPLRDFVPEWNSHPGTRTGVNSHPRDILWWYHVNKYRAMRGNRSELALRWKLPRCPVNTPLPKNELKWLGSETYYPLIKDASRKGMFLSCCPHCRQKFSLRSGSFFQRSHLSLKVLVAVMIPILPQNSCEYLRKTSPWICLPPSSDGLG